MKIAFWSPLHGVGGTAAMLAITLAVATDSDKSILLTQTHYSMNYLEGPLVGEIDGPQGSDYFRDIGVDAVVKYFKAGLLSKEVMENCAIDITSRLSLLAGTKQSSRRAYDDSVLRKIVGHVLDAAEDFYDWVVVDTNSGYSSSSIETVQKADVVVVTLRQNRDMLDELFANEEFRKLNSDRILYLFGSYDPNSKYNLNNLRHIYRQINADNSGGLPHSTAYMDALCDRRALKYITANMVAEDYGDTEFFRALKDISRKITAMAARKQR